MAKPNKYNGNGSLKTPGMLVWVEELTDFVTGDRPRVIGRNAQKRVWRALHGVRK